MGENAWMSVRSFKCLAEASQRTKVHILMFMDWDDPAKNSDSVQRWMERLDGVTWTLVTQPEQHAEICNCTPLAGARIVSAAGWRGGQIGTKSLRSLIGELDPPDLMMATIGYNITGARAAEDRPRRGSLRKLALEWSLLTLAKEWSCPIVVQNYAFETVRILSPELICDRFLPRFSRLGAYFFLASIMTMFFYAFAWCGAKSWRRI